MTSIWLRPEGRQERALQRLIDHVATEHGTVAFPPHLTVCGGIGDLAVLDAAAGYVEKCGLLPLIPAHISLLYTLDRVTQAPRADFDAARLQAIAARCAEAIEDTHLTLARPVVNSAGGETDVGSWKIIRSL